MSLENIIRPIKYADKQVQKQYTKIGRKIPEKHLYKVTTCLMAGSLSLGAAGLTSYSLALRLAFGAPFGIDTGFNLNGLLGEFFEENNGNSISKDPKKEGYLNLSRIIRFPIFTTSVYFFGNAALDIFNKSLSDHNFAIDHTLIGLGFLGLASSMYLKDQDPKLLEKQPSKLKALMEELGKKLDEKVKSYFPKPTIPIKVPVTYRTIDNYL